MVCRYLYVILPYCIYSVVLIIETSISKNDFSIWLNFSNSTGLIPVCENPIPSSFIIIPLFNRDFSAIFSSCFLTKLFCNSDRTFFSCLYGSFPDSAGDINFNIQDSMPLDIFSLDKYNKLLKSASILLTYNISLPPAPPAATIPPILKLPPYPWFCRAEFIFSDISL